MAAGSRLDRLIVLLDTGSTPSVRLTAARQLGTIAGTRVLHPSTASHGHASVTGNVSIKVEEISTESESVWHGVDGEWDEVIQLVARILPHLQSKSSETRQAAASALLHISQAVGVWDPTLTAPSPTHELEDQKPAIDSAPFDHLKTTKKTDTVTLPLSSSSPLKNFDVSKVLLEGGLLLSSSGNEYAHLSTLSAEELAKAQSAALKNLGLGLGAVGGGTEDELGVDMTAELAAGVSASGATVNSTNKGGAEPSAVAATNSASAIPTPVESNTDQIADETEDYNNFSARERNKLKRKRKAEAKSGGGGPDEYGNRILTGPPPAKMRIVDSDIDSTFSKTDLQTNGVGQDLLPQLKAVDADPASKVIVDPAAKAREIQAKGAEDAKKLAQLEVNIGEWPWKIIFERLVLLIFSSKWEIRHGASLGLKSLLKLQGVSGGKIAGLTLEENEVRHNQWADELVAKLLCIFALDRFGDYNSDQVVAPVRETAAQALATLLPFMADSSVYEVQRSLVDMVRQSGAIPLQPTIYVNGSDKNPPAKYIWQVRHSGLLGLKYLVAVKGHLFRLSPTSGPQETGKKESGPLAKVKLEMKEENIPELGSDGLAIPLVMLKSLVHAALIGLRDRDDDVRSAAAATLSPIADLLLHHLPDELNIILNVLWDCLSDLKDDLSSSIGGVMELLAKLLSFTPVLNLMQSPAFGRGLADLVPRLYPFFRHTITSVRLSVILATEVFLGLREIDASWAADVRLLRLLFQNLIVEERLEIREGSMRAWSTLIKMLPKSTVVQLTKPYLSDWFMICSNPIGTAIDAPRLFWSAKASLSGQGGFVFNVDKAILAQDMALISSESIMRGRLAAASALGLLMDVWPHSSQKLFEGMLVDGLTSNSAFKRFIGATVVEEWANAYYCGSYGEASIIQASALASSLSAVITKQVQTDTPVFSELLPILSRIQVDCEVLYNIFRVQGKVPPSKVPEKPADFTLQHARQTFAAYDMLIPFIGRGLKAKITSDLEFQRGKVHSGIRYYESVKAQHDRQVNAALGAALIGLQCIPSKLTPVIRSITNSLKNEDDLSIQTRSARSIAAFIDLCCSPNSTIKTNPSDKLIKNICTFLCQDTSRTPIFAGTKSSSKSIMTLEYKPATGLAAKESKEQRAESDENVAARLVGRGARLALSELALRFGDTLLERVPKIWSCMSEALLSIYASGEVRTADRILASDDQQGQDLLDCLTVLPSSAQKLGSSLHHKIALLFPALSLAARSSFSVVRYSVARCFAELCDILPSEGLKHVVMEIVPVIGDPLNKDNRSGAIELLSHIVELLDVKILPYVIFFVVPVLGRMSDPDDDIRLVATNTFAQLIKLVPLEAGLPDPPGFSSALLIKRQGERDFLAQLLDGTKVEEYKIPFPIGIELRKYQRDGVSWLAFLAKYQLHGLLCDDMGLGKTLQSICILGSMHHERAERYRESGSVEAVHLPSLIICPPTLTGHWQHELRTYAGSLRSIVYTGAKSERERLVPTLKKYDAVIMSYEIARNDIDLLNRIEWHYCILDEGHIIKNGKTKLTIALKSIRAIHRLILSGTPIQNNVLELWSLFDFLMPGFLGSEKAFNDRFGKPIAASRDAKSSSKEQEAGALALEALHKQVLPFLLRRLKEDVLDDLPPKIIQDYYCELSLLQKRLYDDFSNTQAKQLIPGEHSSTEPKPQHVFQALQYLRKLVNHPALVFKAENARHQAIFGDVANGDIRNVSNAPKLQALRQILLDCGIGQAAAEDGSSTDAVSQHRVLIFCQLKQMLDIVENDLFKALMPTVTYMRLDGTTDVSKRHAVVQTFNVDPSIDALLLTTHVGGLGLNLTGADTVIFVEHDWNPMKDLQAMDRAHRLGQKKVVNVYRLIMRGTLEEKIMGLQRFKLNIASSVITQQNSDLATLGTDQVLDLFNVTSSEEPPAVIKDRPMGQKAILESLGELPPEDEYGDLDFSAFTASITSA